METLSTYPETYEIISRPEETLSTYPEGYKIIHHIHPEETYTLMDNCGGYGSHINCAPDGIHSNVLRLIIVYLGIVAIISFFVTLGFYLIYKHKDDEHPRKHAIKRSWPWWIVLPFIVLGILILFGY